MTDTANLGLPFIEASQAQKHVTHNEALRILDAAIQIAVLDRDRTMPPASPGEGERHVVATGATGAWAGHVHAIATWQDGAWAFLAPKPGWCIWSVADDVVVVFDGAVWRDLRNLALDNVAHLGVNSAADGSNRLSVKSNAALFAAVNAADGGSGDMRLQLSKESAAKTASVVFSDSYSGRAEFGLIGADAFRLKVSADGAGGIEAFTIDQATGNLTLPRGLALSGVSAPSPITANQNDYNPAGIASASVLQISSDAARSISGLASGAEGRVVSVINVGSQPVTLLDDSAASAAANRFAVGGDLAISARQAAILRYDGAASRWQAIARPAAASGGTSATARQNALLNGIYLSKALASARRTVLEFCDGYKGSDGINAGASSNYVVDTIGGKVSPTTTSAALIAMGGLTTIGDFDTRLAAFTDGTTGQANAASSAKTSLTGNAYVGKDLGSGVTKKIDHVTFYPSSDSGFSGGGIANLTINLRGNTSVPSSRSDGTLLGTTGAIADTTSTQAINVADATAYRYVWLEFVASAGTDQWFLAEWQLYEQGSVNNATMVTTSQATDTSVSNGRVLIEFDNVAGPTLNTDLTVEVTCDGGAHWTSAALSAVTSYSQGGHKIAETADQACASGTSFAARIKTLNNKSIPMYGVSLTVH